VLQVQFNYVCAGQMSDVETAIHSMRTMFSKDHAEGMLLVDASNAFNSLQKFNLKFLKI